MINRQNALVAGLARMLARLTAGRLEWVRGAWAESSAVPPGPRRLAWRLGTAWLAVRQLLAPRDIASAAAFAAAASAVAWMSWRGSPANVTTLSHRVDAIALAGLLAAVTLLGRLVFGPVSDGWPGRVLRAAWYAGILAILPLKAAIEQFTFAIPPGGERLRLYGFVMYIRMPAEVQWNRDLLILLILTGYAIAVVWMTSRRARITRASLAIGVGTGVAFGAVMYLVAPLGLQKHSVNPWFSGSGFDLLVALAWVMLFGGPIVAAVLAARISRAPGGSGTLVATMLRQGVAAGLLANLTGALTVTLAGSATITLMLKSAAVRNWLLSSEHLSANAMYVRELNAGADIGAYFVMCIFFPLFALACSAYAAAVAAAVRNSGPADSGPSGGQPQPSGPRSGPIPSRL
jgi:hypothetical protein